MNRDLQRSFDVLVIGGGPAGMAAAVRAAEHGVDLGLVDDNAAYGGQIWRGESTGGRSHNAVKWRELLETARVTKLCGRRVFDQPEVGVLLAEGKDDLCELRYKKLILATGARERFLPFPGWTLPNVIGAGGLQALVKSGLPIQGKRVVVAGTGPLLLAVAAYLRKHGAEIPIICEQASWNILVRFGVALVTQPKKVVQGLQLKRELSGVPFAANSWPIAAGGQEVLVSVTVSRAGKPETFDCDYLACGFHLVPNVELPQLLGCRIHNGNVWVDEWQRTSVEGVYCAGEPTGIAGVELAIIQGQIAGLAAAGAMKEARRLFRQRARALHFAQILRRTFCLRPELRKLPLPETLVCRCEDVPYSRLQRYSSWRAAKLHSRCGMGPCQGRVCGPASQFLFSWNSDSVRPPVFPARVESLSALVGGTQQESSLVGGGSS